MMNNDDWMPFKDLTEHGNLAIDVFARLLQDRIGHRMNVENLRMRWNFDLRI